MIAFLSIYLANRIAKWAGISCVGFIPSCKGFCFLKKGNSDWNWCFVGICFCQYVGVLQSFMKNNVYLTNNYWYLLIYVKSSFSWWMSKNNCVFKIYDKSDNPIFWCFLWNYQEFLLFMKSELKHVTCLITLYWYIAYCSFYFSLLSFWHNYHFFKYNALCYYYLF